MTECSTNNQPRKVRLPDSRKRSLSQEGVHPAAIFVAVFMAVAIGRLPELFEFLQPFQLGKLTVLIAVLSVVFSTYESSKVTESPIGRRISLFAALGVFSLSFSIWGSRTLQFLEQDLLIIVMLFVLIFKTAVNERTIRFYILTLATILGIMVAFGILSQTTSRVSFSNSYDANDVGLMVVTLSALMFGISSDKGFSLRLFAFALGIAGFAVALSTQSRGAFLGLCAVSAFFAISRSTVIKEKFYRVPNLRVVAGFFVCLVVVVALVPAESWVRILTVFELESDYNTLGKRGRSAIWERGISFFLGQPWGAGGGAYQAADMEAGGTYITAHNSFLQVAVELGALGLILFLGFWRQSWKIAARLLSEPNNLKRESGALSAAAIGLGVRGALVGFFVSGFFLSMAYGRIFYAILAIAAATEVVYLRKVKDIELADKKLSG